MERRHFLKLAFGFAAGAVALAAGAEAEAAPLAPQPLQVPPGNSNAQPAVTTGDEIDRLAPEEVHWGRGRRRGWHRGWGRRRWRRRHWGWHRRRRRRRRYWRRRYW